ncbi:MAG: type II secretion system protein GspE, partial [Cellulomonadaceae bacterium]|nr:type II secretion system protein GspE [Cellulomonadaceae bacterium]
MKQLGDILLDDGLVTEAQLMAALDEQVIRGESLGRVLVEIGMLTEAQLVRALANQVGMQFIELGDYPVDRNAVAMVPSSLCRRYTVLPISIIEGYLILAMADPGNVLAVDDAHTLSRMPVQTVVATRDDLMTAIDRFCRADEEIDDLASAFEESVESTDADLSRVGDSVEDDAPIVRFVNLLVTQAIQDRASDIHIEPAEKDLRVRYRIDGVLHEMQRAPKQIQSGVISR